VGDASSAFWQLHSPGIINLILNYPDRCTEVLLSYPKIVEFCWSNCILCGNHITKNEDTKRNLTINKHSTDDKTFILS
jgi:hypothetical protein